MHHKKTFHTGLALFALVLPAAAQQIQDTTRQIVAAPVVDTNPGANLPAQPVGPEDLLSLRTYDSPEFSLTVRIAADGTIRLPLLQHTIRVEGLLPPDIETLVAEELKREKFLTDPFVTVNIVEYHSRPINVTGAVRQPTIFQAVGTVTLLDALARAGGLVPDQAGPEILVTKPNGDTKTDSIQRIPWKPLMNGTEPGLNLKLTGGETIRVPDVAKFTVAGSVSHPGLYPIVDGNANTVITAIAQAQGTVQYFSHTAYIYRPDANGTPREIQIKLGDILQRKSADVAILPRDVLYIPDSSGRRITDRTVTALTSVAGGAAVALTYVLR